MITKIISLNECRMRLPTLWKEAIDKATRFVVTVHSKPKFEIRPLDEDFEINDDWDVQFTEKDRKAYEKAMKDFKAGKNIFTMEDIISDYNKTHKDKIRLPKI